MKPCSRCGVTKPSEAFYVERSGRLKSQCKDCAREGKRRWKAENPERDKEQWQRWRSKQPEGTLPYQKAWAAAQDPGRMRAKRRAWKRANPEKVSAINRASYQRNLAASRARSITQFHRRRDAIGDGVVPAELVSELREQPCSYCGATEHIEIDHIIPLSRGGTHTPENLAPACRFCNRSKGAKLLSEWLLTADA